MVQQKGKQRKLIIIGAIVALLLIVGIVVVVNALGSGKSDPYKQVETTNTPDASSTDDSNDTPTTPAPDTNTPEEDDTSADSTLDPATVSTVNIEPMDLTVSYVKGNAGFEFFVMRTASGTQYVEFSSPELAGTKCTNDKGVFASIIESPSATESTTLTKTETIDGTKYGLSLADETCTSNPELLKQFQASFSDAFSLLKRIEA